MTVAVWLCLAVCLSGRVFVPAAIQQLLQSLGVQYTSTLALPTGEAVPVDDTPPGGNQLDLVGLLGDPTPAPNAGGTAADAASDEGSSNNVPPVNSGAGAGAGAGPGAGAAPAVVDVRAAAEMLASLRAGVMKAVKAKAQKFVPVPEGLDLDTPFAAEQVRRCGGLCVCPSVAIAM